MNVTIGQLVGSAMEATKEDAESKTCAWTQDDEGDSWWGTECGQIFAFSHDGPNGPSENDFKWCCFCGGRLEEIRYEDAEGRVE